MPGGKVQDVQRGYFPALDGLRALAVVAVLLFHGGHLSGGFLGVDTFFVISGFLITGLLLREVELTGTVRLGAFWARRARRLLPALALMVSAVTLWSVGFGTPSERLALHADSLWSLSFLMNWHEVTSAHDYWSSFALQSPLTHLWSLAVEEQFYLVWPLTALAIAVWARRPHRAMFATCTGGAVASFVLMAALYDPAASTRAYEGTDARIGALMLGGLCATSTARSVVARLLGGTSRSAKAAVAASVTVASIGTLLMYGRAQGNDPVLFRGGFFVFAIEIAIIICAITAIPTASRAHPLAAVITALSLRPLRSIGRLSYGLYLWHWPIFLALSPVRTGLSDWPLLALRLSVTWVVAVASYRLVEHPIRIGLQHRASWVSAPVTASAVGVAALLAVTVALPNAGATAVNVSGIAALAASTARAQPPTQTADAAAPHAVSTKAGLRSSIEQAPPSSTFTTTTQAPAKHPAVSTVVFLGDSIAYTAAPGIEAAFQAAGVPVVSGAAPGIGLIKFSNYFDFLRTAGPVIDGHSFLVLLQLSVWDIQYGQEKQYAALTLLHQFIVDRGGQMAIMSPPPMRADQTKGDDAVLIAAAQRLANDFPSDVIFLDASAVWGHDYRADLNADHVPERMYDGVHICASGAALLGAWLVASVAQAVDGMTPAPVQSWAGAEWTKHPIYDSPPGTCAAV